MRWTEVGGVSDGWGRGATAPQPWVSTASRLASCSAVATFNSNAFLLSREGLCGVIVH